MSKKIENEVIASNSNNQNILYAIIIVLLIIIAIGAFFIGMKLGGTNSVQVQPSNNASINASGIADNIVVNIYDDKRCSDCQTDVVIQRLKELPVLTNANFIKKDFSEEGVSDFLAKNNVKTLPAAIFSTNAVGPDLAQHMVPLDSGEYSLALGGTHDPFIKRSDKGLLIADKSILTELQATAYPKGAADAKITWIEFTDVNCYYCKKMEQDGTAATVLAKFPEELNKTSSNFIGTGGAATQKAAEILECSGKAGGADVYNKMISKVLVEGDNSEETMLTIATENGLDRAAIKSCLDNGDMKDVVAQKFNMGTQNFGITGTPGNVLINNETGEYEVVSGAYPAEKFIETVNLLLGNG